MISKRHAAALLLLTLFGCTPDLDGSVEAWVYRMEPAAGTYALVRDTVDNLESLRELRGRDLDVRAGSELNSTLGGLQIVRGSPFSLEYTIDGDGVVRPGDLHSFYALSMYRNLDRVASLLRAHGHVPLKRLDVFYFPRMDNLLLGDTRSQFTDNAAFASEAGGFLIVPSFVLADVPMFLNEGVMAHEYGHAVIHQELFGATVEEPGDDRHLTSMHEGVADLFGFADTGDPNYIGPTAQIDRDLSIPRDYTDADFAELTDANPDALFDTFDPHFHGSVMARAIYEAWPKLPDGSFSAADRGRLIDLTLQALRDLDYVNGTFSLGSFPNALVQLLDVSERPSFCAVLRVRLAPLADQFTHCEGY